MQGLVVVLFHRTVVDGDVCSQRPRQKHCVGSRVLCWPRQSKADAAAGELLPARDSSRYSPEPEPLKSSRLFILGGSAHFPPSPLQRHADFLRCQFAITCPQQHNTYTFFPLSIQILISKRVKVIE
jgi:hypothetical protein